MTFTRQQRPCPVPPHPQDPENAEPPAIERGDSALSRFRRWVAHAPAERAPAPAIPAVWTAAEIMHLAGISGVYPGGATIAAVLTAGWIGEHRKGSEHPRLAAAELAAATGAVSGWITAADIWGPLTGRPPWLTVLYMVGAGGGYWWLRTHKAVQAARDRRDAAAADIARKTAWHRLAALLGLKGSHLLSQHDTLLGETWLIDTTGTGKLASSFHLRHIAERLGEIEMIPVGRIDIDLDYLPGRIRITIRRRDPWAHPLMHPAAHPDSPFAKYVEEPATCRKPLVIGGDPETGAPLLLPLWDEDEGGKVIMITAKKGSGKTVLLSCISERITACTDAELIQVNLGKHREDRRWAPLAAANALGRDEIGRARRALAWVVAAIEERSKSGDDSKVQPSPQTRLLVVKVDEVDQVARDAICKQLLSDIASKCRSEGAALIISGQRATAQWVGGADLRANVDIAVLGRFSRPSEAKKATGDDIDLPDMGSYGEGKPGVWMVYELGGGGDYSRGRVFKLEDPREIDAIVARRLQTRRRYIPEPALAVLSQLWDQVTGDAPVNDEDACSTSAVAAADPVMQGTADITAKTSAALNTLAATEDDLAGLPAIPPDKEAHAAAMRAERQRQALAANYGDIDIPAPVREVLMRLLADPAGTSAQEAGDALKAVTGSGSKSAAFRYLTALRVAGAARLDGSGRGARYRLASAPEPPGTHPGLTLAPPPDRDDYEDEDDEAGNAP